MPFFFHYTFITRSSSHPDNLLLPYTLKYIKLRTSPVLHPYHISHVQNSCYILFNYILWNSKTISSKTFYFLISCLNISIILSFQENTWLLPKDCVPGGLPRELEGLVATIGLGSMVVVLLFLFAVFIKPYNLPKILNFNLTPVDYVTYYSSYISVIFRSQFFSLASREVCSWLPIRYFHITPVIILGDFSINVLHPDNSQAPCLCNLPHLALSWTLATHSHDLILGLIIINKGNIHNNNYMHFIL